MNLQDLTQSYRHMQLNAVEPRREWLEVAKRVYRFVSAHGPLDDGHGAQLLNGDGTIEHGYDSIYVDGFEI